MTIEFLIEKLTRIQFRIDTLSIEGPASAQKVYSAMAQKERVLEMIEELTEVQSQYKNKTS